MASSITATAFSVLADNYSAVSKSCFYHIRDLKRIRNTTDHTTAFTIATTLINSKLVTIAFLF